MSGKSFANLSFQSVWLVRMNCLRVLQVLDSAINDPRDSTFLVMTSNTSAGNEDNDDMSSHFRGISTLNTSRKLKLNRIRNTNQGPKSPYIADERLFNGI